MLWKKKKRLATWCGLLVTLPKINRFLFVRLDCRVIKLWDDCHHITQLIWPVQITENMLHLANSVKLSNQTTFTETRLPAPQAPKVRKHRIYRNYRKIRKEYHSFLILLKIRQKIFRSTKKTISLKNLLASIKRLSNTEKYYSNAEKLFSIAKTFTNRSDIFSSQKSINFI